MPDRSPILVRLLSLAALASLVGCDSVDRAVAVPTAYVSHQLCSAVFIAGLEPEQFYREAIAPEVAPVGFLLNRRLDRDAGTVASDLAGLAPRQARYRGAYGCLVQRGDDPQPSSETPMRVHPETPVVDPISVDLGQAVDRAFEEPPAPPHRLTKAVVVMQDGRIVAERYAPGVGVDTPLMGWSMTKSVTNALIGILARQGELSIDGPAPVMAWGRAEDPRRAVSIDHLLRMTSGLELGGDLGNDWTSAFDPSVQALFAQDDTAAFFDGAKLTATPGERWRYANGATVILSGVLRAKLGGDAASVLRFARRELFEKLDMRHATLEFDAVGAPFGASHMWATARDWARFGQLYLDDGMVGGRRILPEGWVDYSARLTPGSESFGYGAGFWTNRGANGGAARTRPDMPRDSFMARGSQGQYVVIVPSARLVIVRLGHAQTPGGDIAAVNRLVADVVAAVSKRP